jgi:hypothetical protein
MSREIEEPSSDVLQKKSTAPEQKVSRAKKKQTNKQTKTNKQQKRTQKKAAEDERSLNIYCTGTAVV